MVKIKLFVLAISAMVFLGSCGNSVKEGSLEKKDSVVIIDSKLQKAAVLFKPGTLPFVVDTTMLLNIEKGDSLGTFEIQALAQHLFKHDLLNNLPYDLQTFYHIDSLKSMGKYKEYCDSLDIGMTKYSTAHALNEIQLDANTLILIWALHSSSYEACPYSENNTVYFTIVYKGNVDETFLLGESSSFADAPVSSVITLNGKLLADGTFSLDRKQVNDQDPDSALVEITKAQYSFAITTGIIKKVNEKTDTAAIMQERKKAGY